MTKNLMKNEFLEELEPWILDESADGIGNYAPRNMYVDEIKWISRLLDIDIRRIGILVDTVDGDPWMMIDNFWRGDLVMWQEYMHNKFQMSSRRIESLLKSINDYRDKLNLEHI